MAGTHIQVDLKGLKRLQARIEKLGKPDRAKLLRGMGAEVESQTRRRLSEEKTDADGAPWKDWTPGYAKSRHSGHSLLEGEGDLIDSINSQVHGDTVEIGSNLVYAAIHQFGGAEAGMPFIPARPYLGLSSENMTDVLGVVEDFLDDHLGAV